MLENLKTLCELSGISGREEKVREFIISQIKDKAEYSVDALGNLIVIKKGRNKGKNKVMLSAHMDEVGLIITYITDEGYLKFATVGGIEASVLVGRSVKIGEDGIIGVIGIKPTHLLKSEEKDKIPELDSLFIDIGADSQEKALKYVNIGDVAVFNSDFVTFGDDRIKSKALDDRAGCAIMLDLIDSDIENDLYFAFTVQEEVGARGAQTAAYSVNPDYAVVIETTTAADIAGVEKERRACLLGSGGVISFMDRGCVYNRELYNLAFKAAEKNNIKCQPKTVVAGGNDASTIHKSRCGIKTITVSVPCRYLHSPVCVVKRSDIDEVRNLVLTLSNKLCNA